VPAAPFNRRTPVYIVDIANQQTALEIDEAFLREVAECTLSAEQVESAEISLALVDNPTIRDLNIRYLEHDYDTDVLSFLFAADGGTWTPREPEGRRGAGKQIEGEIIVSVEMACDVAREFGWKPADELTLYLVHGLLHLAGYDDLSEHEKAVMRSREREILSRWNLTPHYAEEAETAGDSPRSSEGRP